MKRKFFLIILLIGFMQQNFAQQQITVTGTVTSADDGSALSGVSVKVKGSNTGISTNSEGHFSIKADMGQTLVFTYIDAAPEERVVDASKVINVQLKQGTKTLNEVAVTAFGVKQQVRSLGFSTQNVKASEVVESQQPNIVNALQGKVAGVQITNSSGAPPMSSPKTRSSASTPR